MQPETYSTPILKIEVKTPTNAVKKIFFFFFPLTQNRGKKKEKISAQPHSGFIVPPPFTHNIRYCQHSLEGTRLQVSQSSARASRSSKS
jgi:hypothetical protein